MAVNAEHAARTNVIGFRQKRLEIQAPERAEKRERADTFRRVEESLRERGIDPENVGECYWDLAN
jgi:hypothetical protein